ncbi:MAG: cysK [Dehalococcoidia bacterium]|nr:cysK [Dehalococcoidia bacterium]
MPGVLNRSIIDEIIAVEDEDAYDTALSLAREEGLLVGVSAGANVYASLQIAKRLGVGKRVVTVLPDTGERYLSLSAMNREPGGMKTDALRGRQSRGRS